MPTPTPVLSRPASLPVASDARTLILVGRGLPVPLALGLARRGRVVQPLPATFDDRDLASVRATLLSEGVRAEWAAVEARRIVASRGAS